MARVLVVDDDFTIVRVLADVIEKLGHKAILCSDGLDAIALLELRKPNAIITDWQLGSIDGLDILEATLRKAPLARRILVTASPTEPEVRQALREGLVQHLIEKPWSLADLRVALRGL